MVRPDLGLLLMSPHFERDRIVLYRIVGFV